MTYGLKKMVKGKEIIKRSIEWPYNKTGKSITEHPKEADKRT